jgi:D-alanyl-D-alanine carboxypeptidase/D-alanyl-D-alanine-endopeptidase (penicillin-binding protein 4)
MKEIFSRRLFLAGLGSVCGSAVLANAPARSLRPVARPSAVRSGTTRNATSAEALIAQANLGGEVGFSVVDPQTGRVLEERQGGTSLPPASIAKSITALYALANLGASYRFTTRLLAGGPVSNGVLEGDLILVGGGDPTLDTDALAGLAAALKARGIREVRGQLRSFGGALPYVRVVDSDQPDHVAYNPSISGLNLNFNRVHFEWKRSGSGYTTTMDARSGRYRPEVRVARMTVADRNAPVYIYRDGGDHDAWSVARGQLGNGGSRWLPVRKPEAYAAEVFATFARSQGIVLEHGEPVRSGLRGAELASHSSAQLVEILRDMLRYSNNTTAEAVGMTASLRRGGRISSLDDSARAMTAWARQSLNMAGARFVDHSGLGERARVSPTAMARAMAVVHRENALQPILRPFAMRDANGNVQQSHPIKVAAKTGTLYFVSTLAGYMRERNGRDLAFAIFTADTARRARFDSRLGVRPEGASAWNRRSRNLQQQLIERWGQVYQS